MPDRKIEVTVDEAIYRRLRARAAFVGESVEAIVRRDVNIYLGDWGLHYVQHSVQAGETLSQIARRYYQDGAKAAVIAEFNELENPNLLRVGQVLLIPEAKPLQPLPKGESPYLFGLHDRGGEQYMAWAGRKGWVLCTEELGANRNDHTSRSYADLADAGYGVIVRLNHGYHEKGTLPRSEYYQEFAIRCGNFVANSSGCHIWIIGNEPNLAVERPGGPSNGERITPDKYITAFRLCRSEIKRRAGHADDQVVTAAVGPWNVQTPYPANPTGDWIVYFRDVLVGLRGELDGIALHTYGRDSNPANIVSELRMDPPFAHRRKMFRTYRDYMDAIPPSLRTLPVYITETDQNVPWDTSSRGWIPEAYSEIDRWNADPTRQKIRSLILYRWEIYAGDVWYIRGKTEVINDFRTALQRDLKWYG